MAPLGAAPSDSVAGGRRPRPATGSAAAGAGRRSPRPCSARWLSALPAGSAFPTWTSRRSSLLSLLHVSDVHFGPKHLAEPAAAVLELARRRRPAALVVSGDLTQRAKPRQFRAARRWIEQFAGAGGLRARQPRRADVPLLGAPSRALRRLAAPFRSGAGARSRRRRASRSSASTRPSPGRPSTAASSAATSPTSSGGSRRLAERRFPRRRRPPPSGAGRRAGDEPVTRRGAEALAICAPRTASSSSSRATFTTASGSRRRPDRRSGGPLVLHCGTTTSSRGRGPESGGELAQLDRDRRTAASRASSAPSGSPRAASSAPPYAVERRPRRSAGQSARPGVS